MKRLIVTNVSQAVVFPAIGFKLFPGTEITLNLDYWEKQHRWPGFWTEISGLVTAGTLTVDPVDYVAVHDETYPTETDSPLPVIRWQSATQTEIVAAYGFSTLVRMTLADGITRTFQHPLIFDTSVVGEGGLDGGTVEANTLYYLYLVPKFSDPMTFTIQGTKKQPYEGLNSLVFKYIGCIKTDENSNLTLTGTVVI